MKERVSPSGKGITTRMITADNKTNNANMKHTSLHAIKFLFSCKVILFPPIPDFLEALSLSKVSSGKRGLFLTFMVLSGVVWRLSRDDERTIQDMMGSGGCVKSRREELVFIDKSDEVLVSHETLRSAGKKETEVVLWVSC